MTRRFNEAKHTLLVAAIGVAGFLLTTCSPPVAAEPPPAHPCDELVGVVQDVHKHAASGLSGAFLRHYVLTDPRLGGVGRHIVLHIVKGLTHQPEIRRLGLVEFTAASIGFCKTISATDHLVDRRDPVRGMEHGDI